jgi:hypothetical protein
MEMQDRLRMERRAHEALAESARTLDVAELLLRAGNVREAERLKDEARRKWDISESLMTRVRESKRGH